MRTLDFSTVCRVWLVGLGWIRIFGSWSDSWFSAWGLDTVPRHSFPVNKGRIWNRIFEIWLSDTYSSDVVEKQHRLTIRSNIGQKDCERKKNQELQHLEVVGDRNQLQMFFRCIFVLILKIGKALSSLQNPGYVASTFIKHYFLSSACTMEDFSDFSNKWSKVGPRTTSTCWTDHCTEVVEVTRAIELTEVCVKQFSICKWIESTWPARKALPVTRHRRRYFNHQTFVFAWVLCTLEKIACFDLLDPYSVTPSTHTPNILFCTYLTYVFVMILHLRHLHLQHRHPRSEIVSLSTNTLVLNTLSGLLLYVR